MTQTVLVFWSPKGGSGTTVAACVAALNPPSDGVGVTLFDAARHHDCSAALGLTESSDKGRRQVGDELMLEELDLGLDLEEQFEAATSAIEGCDSDLVVVDAGDNPALWAQHATKVIMVIRPDYLALRRFMKGNSHYTNTVLLVAEPGRALTLLDVESVTGLSGVSIPLSASMARMVDAGLLHSRKLGVESPMFSLWSSAGVQTS